MHSSKTLLDSGVNFFKNAILVPHETPYSIPQLKPFGFCTQILRKRMPLYKKRMPFFLFFGRLRAQSKRTQAKLKKGGVAGDIAIRGLSRAKDRRV
jgi:hypothetical protein